ncbi:MAG TPA: hypothetical protein VIF61_00455 [Methylocystis sp.]
MIDLPAGFDVTLNAYFTSPSTGLEAKVGIAGLRSIAQIDPQKVDVDGVISNLIGSGTADDWRLMTAEEVADYRRREAEDEG